MKTFECKQISSARKCKQLTSEQSKITLLNRGYSRKKKLLSAAYVDVPKTGKLLKTYQNTSYNIKS